MKPAIRNRNDYLLHEKNHAIFDLHQEKGKKRPVQSKITALALAAAQAELDYIRDCVKSGAEEKDILINTVSLASCLRDIFSNEAIKEMFYVALMQIGEEYGKKKR